MSFPSYPEFFEALNGYKPYVWQTRLADLIYGESTPDTVPVETGMGKTQSVSAWLWAYAKQRSEIIAGEREVRTVQTRMHFVVDRRILVDDTAAMAEQIAARLAAPDNDVLARVAEALAPTADPSGALLNVVKLRGGLQQRAEHTNSPITPTLATSTLDLFGSRLLFRGYGLSTGRRPIDAALTGIDSLIVLDEAHLAKQFRRTLEMLKIQEVTSETRFDNTVPPRSVMVMSATADGDEGDVAPFDWDEEIAANKALKKMRTNRDNVSIRVEEVTVAKEADAKMAELAIKLGGAPGTAVAVFANTVASAKEIRRIIQSGLSNGMSKDDVVVLHGGVPNAVRENVLEKISPYRTRSSARSAAPALFVVATQTLEVGADIDFDHAITRSSSYDSFVQRAGRVNRVGLRNSATITMVAVTVPDNLVIPDPKKDAKDVFLAENPVYGSAAVKTAAFVNLFGTMGDVRAAHSTLSAEEASEMLRSEPPILTLPKTEFEDYLYTDGLSNEAPVSSWIRAQDPDYGSVQIIWRDAIAELPDDAVGNYLRALPPNAAEAWTVSLSTFRSTPLVIAKGKKRNRSTPRFVVIDAETDISKDAPSIAAKELYEDQVENGMTIVVGSHRDEIRDALDSAEFGTDFSTSVNRRDLFAVLVTGRHDATGVINVASKVWDALEDEESDDEAAVSSILASWKAKGGQSGTGLNSEELFAENVGLMRELVLEGHLSEITELSVGISGDANARLLRVYPPRSPELQQERENLFDHCGDVGDGAAVYGRILGLPEPVIEALRIAGERHDWGKLLPQFQHQLHLVVSTEDYALIHDGETDALAKSSHPSFRRREASRIAQIPSGFRHEALSVTLSEAVGADAGVNAELVNYLIGSHHGHGRGLFPAMDETVDVTDYVVGGVSVQAANPLQDGMSDEALRWVSQFHALTKKYGPYTLALAESLLRLSDWRESATNLVVADVIDDKELGLVK